MRCLWINPTIHNISSVDRAKIVFLWFSGKSSFLILWSSLRIKRSWRCRRGGWKGGVNEGWFRLHIELDMDLPLHCVRWIGILDRTHYDTYKFEANSTWMLLGFVTKLALNRLFWNSWYICYTLDYMNKF